MSGAGSRGARPGARDVVFALLVLAMAAVCVRLGFWQLARLGEKQRMNVALRATLAAPPVVLGDAPRPLETVRDRRVELTGVYDETRQVLLAGRSYQGSPGVEVVTPLRLAGGGAVLVDRGWVPSPDATVADPSSSPEPGLRTVSGIARPLARGSGRTVTRLHAGRGDVWSTRALDLDSLAPRVPYPLAPYVVHQLPGPGVPAAPARLPVEPYDEGMHVSYAIQWFAFAAILLGGSSALAWGRFRRRSP